MKILFGGAFNPPTLAHYEIVKFILKQFPDSTLTFLPTNNYYNKNIVLEPFIDRFNMISILQKKLGNRVNVSDFEFYQNEYKGTYYTLKTFKDYYFLIGYDSLKNMNSWIKYEDLVSEFKFIVIPRESIDPYEIINNDPIMKKNINNFIILDKFIKVDISSTDFRFSYDKNLVDEDVYNYIIKHNLYKNNGGK